jgi:predicted nucleic acid-binding protein
MLLNCDAWEAGRTIRGEPRRPAVRDPDDDMVLEAAVNGQADAIVTFNIGDFGEAAQRFGVEVLAPGAAWKRVEKGK